MAHGGKREGAGRKKGSESKATIEVRERLAELNCDPIEGMAKLATGDAPCMACDDDGQVTMPQYYLLINKRMPDESVLEQEFGVSTHADLAMIPVACPRCGGSGRNPVDPVLSGNMYKELANYIAPKRKAIEHSGAVGMTHEEKLRELE